MEKFYLAGFRGSMGLPPVDCFITMSRCLGYFDALKDEGLLKEPLITDRGSGFIAVGEEHFKEFCKSYGNDVRLWEMLTVKARQEKRAGVHVIRSEVNDTGGNSGKSLPKGTCRSELYKSLVHLSTNYPNLEFVIYSSDIEAKS